MNTDSVQLLCEQVLGDARTEAEEILRNASDTIREKTARSEKEIAATLLLLAGKAGREGEQEIKKIRSRINIEEMRKASAVKEAKINSVISLLEEKMSGREDIILKLASEAVFCIGESRVRVLAGEAEWRILNGGFIEEMKASGIGVTLEQSGKNHSIRAMSEDGRIMFDNSCGAKIARDRDKIRSIISRWLK